MSELNKLIVDTFDIYITNKILDRWLCYVLDKNDGSLVYIRGSHSSYHHHAAGAIVRT